MTALKIFYNKKGALDILQSAVALCDVVYTKKISCQWFLVKKLIFGNSSACSKKDKTECAGLPAAGWIILLIGAERPFSARQKLR